MYNGKKEDEGYDLLRFLNAIMYPHKADFIETVSEYIDFSKNEELWEEDTHMDGLGECIYREIKEEVREEVKEEVREEGIQAMVLENLEEQIPLDKIIAKLQKFFGLTKEMSEQYCKKFTVKI